MKLIGIDFDNTLVRYDELFHKIAVEEGLINKSHPKSKKDIRDYLRSINKDDEFTEMQAEVYGRRISEASPCKGAIEALRKITDKNVKLKIISHKTIYPIKGPKYNLREAALDWLDKNDFFTLSGLGMTKDDVYFKPTKEEKIKLIETLKCDIFIDDLEEILEMINIPIKKILYEPLRQVKNDKLIVMKDWSQLEDLTNEKQ